MKTIVFQGDSITDVSRSREDNAELGGGYPFLVKAKLGCDFPEEFNFYNRGISGNRVVDLYARIKIDIINLKPDYLSILIGVNDVWHELSGGNGVDNDKFKRIYSMLIEEITAALPDIKIIILEPFVLNGTATAENIDYFRREVKMRAAVARELAEQYKLSFIPLQECLNEALKRAPDDYWLKDGVHPTSIGHELIAREWIKTFEKIK